MDAFKVFATLSLVDAISAPLKRIKAAMKGTDGAVAGLSGQMGRFAVAMAPIAVAAAGLLTTFGFLTREAIAFESVMADVAKVVNFESAAALKAMGEAILDLSTRIPMAAEGLGAIVAAAAQSGIAKQDLLDFTEQAAKMGVAFDLSGDQAGKMMAAWRAGMNLSLPRVYALADATNHLANNLNATAPALGEVIQRVGPLAMAAGLAETQVAALGAAFLSAGASPEVAATALRKFTTTLVQGSAMADRQAEAFRGLGFDAVQMAKDMQTDAQGTIMRVLKTLSDKPKELQVSLLTQMFGEQGLGAIAPLLSNIGNLSQAFDLVASSAAYAGSMQGEFNARAATTQNALTLFKNRATALAITIGNAFLPAVKAGAEFLGSILEGIRTLLASPFGQWLLKISAGLAAGIVAATAFAAGVWLVKAAGAAAVKALMPLKAAILSISWPVWAVIAAFAAFYLAYRTNFGGFADYVDKIWQKASLIFNGVKAVMSSLKDGVGEIRGELGQEIQAEGLLGTVATISRLLYRVIQLFKGWWDGFSAGLSRVGSNFSAVFGKIGGALKKIWDVFRPLVQMLAPGDVNSAASSWEQFGRILGRIAGWTLELLSVAIMLIVNAVSLLIDYVRLVIAVFTGDWAAAGKIFNSILNTIGENILAVADLFGFGDWLREAWQGAMDFLGGIDLFESGMKIIATLGRGIIAAKDKLVDSVAGVFATVREYLPFSDAKKGPLSALTASGAAIMTTLGAGVDGGRTQLVAAVGDAFAAAGEQCLIPEAPLPGVPTPDAASGGAASGRSSAAAGAGGRAVSIHIGRIDLPNVANAHDFVAALQDMIAEYDGVPA